jgi:hypothetical protein
MPDEANISFIAAMLGVIASFFTAAYSIRNVLVRRKAEKELVWEVRRAVKYNSAIELPQSLREEWVLYNRIIPLLHEQSLWKEKLGSYEINPAFQELHKTQQLEQLLQEKEKLVSNDIRLRVLQEFLKDIAMSSSLPDREKDAINQALEQPSIEGRANYIRKVIAQATE